MNFFENFPEKNKVRDFDTPPYMHFHHLKIGKFLFSSFADFFEIFQNPPAEIFDTKNRVSSGRIFRPCPY